MKKEDYRQWLSEKVVTQTKLVTAAAVAMLFFGLIAICLELALVKGIVGLFIGPGFPAFVTSLGILGAVLYSTWLRLPKHLGDVPHPAIVNGEEASVFIAPTMSVVWTFALGSIDSDRTWVERLLGLLALPQRLLVAGSYVLNRVKELRELNIPGCAAVLKVLFRKAERMEVSDLADKLTKTEIPGTLRQVSLIDGVIFLTRATVAVSLAPRMVDDLNAWKARRGAVDDTDD